MTTHVASASVQNEADATPAEVPDGKAAQQGKADEITLRPPQDTDGLALHRLIAASPPLDPNSMYCNLLQCVDFADTAVAAERDGELVGFISGYIPPRRPDTLFVWQVVVARSARGLGLGKRMLQHLLTRLTPQGIRYLDTTITEDNAASWALFKAVARDRGAAYTRTVRFDRGQHFGDCHDTEFLLRIGPF